MNPRFQDYVTSGAFSLTLTRAQIAALSSLQGGSGSIFGGTGGLERRGLAEPISAESDERTQWRMTGAGALALALLAEAGLVNTAGDPLAGEIDSLRAELEKARRAAEDAKTRAWTMRARKDEAERECARLRREVEQLREPPIVRLKPGFGCADRAYDVKPLVRLRDLHPELSDAELMEPLR